MLPTVKMLKSRSCFFREGGFGKSLTEFARCIHVGAPYPVAIADVLHGVAVLEAAIPSAATARPGHGLNTQIAQDEAC